MATVSGPTTVPCSCRPSGSSSSRVVDPYYGHEKIAKICARFVTHLFACPDLPLLSTTDPPGPFPPLANFIAYALHRTRLHPSVTFAALYLLQRLKARYPSAKGSSGHRLCIAGFMIASKVLCDDTYSNKSWSIVSQSMLTVRHINQMEREICSYLEWHRNIEPKALKEFEAKVRRDFKGLGPYPTYLPPSPAPDPMPSTTPHNAQTGGTTITPSFAPRSQQAPPTEPSKAMAPPIPVHAGSPPTVNVPSSPSSPSTPDTPDCSMSDSASPASSASPVTPAGVEDHSVRVADSEMIGTPMDIDSPSPPVVHPRYNRGERACRTCCAAQSSRRPQKGEGWRHLRVRVSVCVVGTISGVSSARK